MVLACQDSGDKDPDSPQTKTLSENVESDNKHKEGENCNQESSLSCPLSSLESHASTSSSESSSSSSAISSSSQLQTSLLGNEKQFNTQLPPPSEDVNEGSDSSSDSGNFSTSPYNESMQNAQDKKLTTKLHCFSIDFLLSHERDERPKHSPVKEMTYHEGEQSMRTSHEEDVHSSKFNEPAKNTVSVDNEKCKIENNCESYKTTAKFTFEHLVSSTNQSAGDGNIPCEEIAQQSNESNVVSAEADDLLTDHHFTESDVSNLDERDSSLASQPLLLQDERSLSPTHVNQRENQGQEPGCLTPNKSKRVKRKLKRTQYSKEDLLKLNSKFQEHPWLSPEKQEKLAEEMGYTDTQIKTWFQNKRASIFGSRKPKKRVLQEIEINAFSQSHFTSASNVSHSSNMRNYDANNIPRTVCDAPKQGTLSEVQLVESKQNVLPEIPSSSTDLGQMHTQSSRLGPVGPINYFHNNAMPCAQRTHPLLSQIPWTNSLLYHNHKAIAPESQQQSVVPFSTANKKKQESLRPNRQPDTDLNNSRGHNGLLLPFFHFNPYHFPNSNINTNQTNVNSLYPNSLHVNDPYFSANRPSFLAHPVGAEYYSFTAPNNVSTPMSSSVPNGTGLPLSQVAAIHRPWIEGGAFAYDLQPPSKPKKSLPVDAHKMDQLRRRNNTIPFSVFNNSSMQPGDQSCIASPLDLSKKDSVSDPYSVHFDEFMEHFRRQLHKKDKQMEAKDHSRENKCDENESPSYHVSSTCESVHESDTENVEVD